jgi:alpha-beta hydrolase superfamily lysophospholipase
MHALLAMIMLAAADPDAGDGARPPVPECVVLLHGLGRGPGSMHRIQQRLDEAGYLTWNEGYASRSAPVELLAERYVGAALADCRQQGAARVHFVTHSLGGILVRQYLQQHQVPDLGRVVMLSPPNGGSELAEHLRHYAIYRWAMGPAGSELGTGDDGIVKRLGAVPAECGIITGSASLDPWFSAWLPKPNDGKVSVASAQLEGMRDFLVVPRAHAFIMRDAEVISEVLNFLAAGRFAHDARRAG